MTFQIVWNPADTDTTLTVNSIALGISGGAAGFKCSRATGFYSTGKYYLEAVLTRVGSNVVALGLANSTHSFTTAIGGDLNSLGCFDQAGIFINNIQVGTASVVASGNTLCMAVDFAAKLVWFRVGAGNWNNNASNNPATGVGGVDFSTVTGPYAIACCNNGGDGSITGNFGQSTFSQTAPSGFSAPTLPDPIPLTAWNSSDKAAVLSLSAGNAMLTSSGAGWNNIRALSGYSTGKYYFETWITKSSAGVVSVGAANLSAALTTANIGSTNNSVAYVDSGGVFVNNASIGTAAASATKQTLGVAIDFGAKLIWVRVDGGNWNNSVTANPVLGLEGFNFSAVSGPYYPAASINGTSGTSFTNFGLWSYRNTAPVGFGNLEVLAAAPGSMLLMGMGAVVIAERLKSKKLISRRAALFLPAL